MGKTVAGNDTGMGPMRGRRFAPVERYGLRVTVFAAALVGAGVPFLILLAAVRASSPVTRWDVHIEDAAHRNAGAGVVAAMRVVSAFGRPIALTVAVGLAVVAVTLAGRFRPRIVVYLVVTSLGGGIVNSFVKMLVHRARPALDTAYERPHGFSFPSGHAMSSLVVYGAIVLALVPFVPRRLRRPVVAFAAALLAGIGVSRVILGVHYPTDVAGGWLLGAGWLAGSTALFESWRVEEGSPRVDPLSEGVEPEIAGTEIAGPDLR